MSQIPDYDRGYRDGLRAAVTWLADRAGSMADPHAQAVLNSASTNLGWVSNRGGIPSKSRTRPTASVTADREDT